MTDVALLIADMVRAGVDPDLIGRTAEALSCREPVLITDDQAERRRAADRERKRLRKSAESAEKEIPPTPPKEKHPPTSPKGDLSPQAELLAILDADRAQAVIQHRQRLRKPLTARAAKLLASKLGQAADPNAAADLMIERGWQGFELEWAKNKGVVAPKPFDDSDERWTKRLKLSRERRQWSFAEYGPAPGQPGCRVPRHLLEPSDGVGWRAWDAAA